MQQGSRLIIVDVQEGALKIYEATVEASKKNDKLSLPQKLRSPTLECLIFILL
jgi:hypothetical protein